MFIRQQDGSPCSAFSRKVHETRSPDFSSPTSELVAALPNARLTSMIP
jgi:hypothetical protein